MRSFSFPFEYIFWHYGSALVDIFLISKNYLLGLARFFSVRLLINKFFYPIIPNVKLSGSTWFERFLSKLFLVISGILFRIVTLIVFYLLSLLLISISLLAYIVWIITPVILIMQIINGLTLLLV